MVVRRWPVLSGPPILVALALAISACSGTSAGHSTPKETAAGYAYYAPGVPYIDHQKLYVDHVVQPGKWAWMSAESSGRYTIAQRFDNVHYFTIVILRDGKNVEVVHNTAPGPSLSPDGTKVAWITLGDHDTGTLVVLDLASFRELGHAGIVVRRQGSQAIAVGIQTDNDGTVHYNTVDQRWWSWRPGGNPVRTPQPESPTMHSPAGFPGVKALVALSPDHLWGAWVPDHGTKMYLQKPGDPSSRFTIALPVGIGTGSFVGWDSTTVVGDTVPGNDGTSGRAHCDIVIRTCFAGPYIDSP